MPSANHSSSSVNHLQNEYFEDDVVCLKENTEEIGLITRVGWDEIDDDDDDEEDEEDEDIKADEVDVFWPKGGESSFEKPAKLQVIDRSFLSGDIVAMKKNQSGQTGTVTQVHCFVDLTVNQLDGTSIILSNVPTTRIARMYDIYPEAHVVSQIDKWFGTVVDSFVNVKVRFPCGDVAIFVSADPTFLIPQESSRFGQEESPTDDEDEEESDNEEDFEIYYYVNQRVQTKSSFLEDEESVQWIEKQADDDQHIFGIVEEVKLVKLDVAWLHTLKGNPDDPPLTECPLNGISVVNHFEYHRWEIGEQAYVSESEKGYESLEQVLIERETDNTYPNESMTSGPRPDRMAATIRRTKTFVDVVWQDSTTSHHIASIDMVPADNFLDEDFWPEDPVVQRISNNVSPIKVGIVKKVNETERTCIVRWIGDPLNFKVESNPEEVEEEVPVMELKSYSNWTARLGDVVMTFPKEGQDSDKIAGEISKFENGRIEVVWNDKTRSIHVPDELFIVDTDTQSEDYDDEMDVDYYEDDEEDEEEDGIYVEGNGVVQPAFLGQQSNAWWHESEMDSNNYQLFSAMETPVSSGTPNFNNSPAVQRSPQSAESEEEEEGNEEAKKVAESAIERDQSDSFTVLVDLEDSHFSESISEESTGNHYVSRILKEWELLKRNLPGGIYIRTFENRMDVLQFLLIGSQGTPYADVPFFFELQFPPEYPAFPPSVFFKSYGERVNPNLYVDGTVCLSLLGTWSGKGSENWNSESSNVLQVVLSIHGLILGSSDPYFLEAGYDRLRGTPSGERSSSRYNESAFVFTLESIPRMLFSPPKHFEDIIRSHFHRVANRIIDRCENYLSMAPAEQQIELESNVAASEPQLVDESISNLIMKREVSLEENVISGPSKGFLSSLERLVPVLKEVFESNQK